MLVRPDEPGSTGKEQDRAATLKRKKKTDTDEWYEQMQFYVITALWVRMISD